MNQLTSPKKQRSVTITPPKTGSFNLHTADPFEQLANILRPQKSILEMSELELNQIDAWQNQNRGFMDDDKYRRLSCR